MEEEEEEVGFYSPSASIRSEDLRVGEDALIPVSTPSLCPSGRDGRVPPLALGIMPSLYPPSPHLSPSPSTGTVCLLPVC